MRHVVAPAATKQPLMHQVSFRCCCNCKGGGGFLDTLLQLGILGLLAAILFLQLGGMLPPIPPIGKKRRRRRRKRSSGSEYEGSLRALEMIHLDPGYLVRGEA